MTDDLVKQMWDAYAVQSGGKTFDGKPLPTWDDLGEERQSCWVAASKVASDRIERLEAALRKICDGPRDADKSCAELFAEVCWEARAALEGKDGNV